MENIIKVKADSREGKGKQVAKNLRREGKIPAIIYGGTDAAIPISLQVADIKAVLKTEKGENTVIKIQKGDIELDAMLKEIQYDYLSNNIIHADFLRIDLSKSVIVNVPIVIQGEAIGCKLEDGLFEFITREIKVKCLPTDIPTKYVVDISQLHAGNTIKAGDLELAENIHLVSEPQIVICTVTSKERGEGGEREAAAEATK